MGEQPRRLSEDPQLGPHLVAARSERLSDERLAENERTLMHRLALLAALGAGAGAGAGAAAAAKAAVWTKVGIGAVALITTASVATVVVRERRSARPPVRVAALERAPVVAPTTAQVSPDAAPALPTVKSPAPSDGEAARGARRSTPSARSQSAVPSDLPREPIVSPEAPARESAEQGAGALAEQVRAFERARAALREARPNEALRELDALLAAHPRTALRPEALAARAEALAASGRLDEAIALVRELLSDDSQRARRAEWWRFLGDLEEKRGDCTAALRAYDAALAISQSGPSARAAQHGKERCAATLEGSR